MERKKTILIAVFINAGLLAVLFIAALTMQEDTAEQKESAVAFGQSTPAFKPLYTEPTEPLAFPLTSSPKQEEFPSLPHLQLPVTASQAKPVEEPVVHHLPALVIDPPAPIVHAAPSSSSTVVEITVKKGDSLEKIARGSNTTVEAIAQLNRLSNHSLKIGQVLKIPTTSNIVVAPKPKPAPLEKTAQLPDYYTVKVGDNPWTIAMKHHMKVDELLRINGLNEEKARKLKPGDRLRIR